MKSLFPATIASLFIVIMLSGCYISERELALARADVESLVQVGDSLSDASERLTEAGYKLLYPEPIDPTGKGEYLTQTVALEEVKIGLLDSAFYTVTGGRNSLRPGSPYLELIADMEGTITRVGDANRVPGAD